MYVLNDGYQARQLQLDDLNRTSSLVLTGNRRAGRNIIHVPA